MLRHIAVLIDSTDIGMINHGQQGSVNHWNRSIDMTKSQLLV